MSTERNASHLPTLVRVCKRPVPGHGKQRLASRIGPALAITDLGRADGSTSCQHEAGLVPHRRA